MSKTLKSVEAADAVVKKNGRLTAAQKRPQTMVYLIEVRVPLEHVGEFEAETLDESLNEYGSSRVIDKGVVEGEI